MWNSHRRAPNLILCLLVVLDLYACVCVLPPGQPLLRFLFFHHFPPRELLLHKQTSPLPPHARLGCADLLRLSGRLLSNAVASADNRKPPEARGVTQLLKVWIISLTRHSAFSHCPGCRIPVPALFLSAGLSDMHHLPKWLQ